MKGKTCIDDCKYFFCHFESLGLFELELQRSLFWLQVLQNVVGCKLKVQNSRESFEEIYHLKRILLNGFCFDRITCLLRSLFSFALTKLDFLIPSMCLMMPMMGLNQGRLILFLGFADPTGPAQQAFSYEAYSEKFAANEVTGANLEPGQEIYW